MDYLPLTLHSYANGSAMAQSTAKTGNRQRQAKTIADIKFHAA